jgi:hypothetical protein
MGIEAESEDPHWAHNLTSEEADLACRYALIEAYQLSPWLADLAAAHPDSLNRVIGQEVEAELNEPLMKGLTHSMLLQGLQYARTSIAVAFVNRLLVWLESSAPELTKQPYNVSVEERLSQVVRVVVAHSDETTRAQLKVLAEAQLSSTEASPYFAFWLPLLSELDPAQGASVLISLTADLPVEKSGRAVELIGSVRWGKYGLSLSPSVLPTELLLKLTLLVHRHVLEKDDEDHQGVYSPQARDHAENGRRATLKALLQAPGLDGFKAKISLSQHPLFSDMRDRIIALAREWQAEEADAAESTTDDVALLYRTGELPPRTGLDMAQLLEYRIDDLQELMLRDTGPRAAWAMVDDENSLRPAIARELELGAKGAYTVDQEAVTVDGKETDIRLRSLAGHQATIELKIGEKPRSGKELRDTIGQQLVRKYMAHKDARTGCLLVTVSDPYKRWRHPDTKASMDRFQLQEMLSAAAAEAQDRLGGNARVLACVLDLTPRLEPEKSSKT